MLGTNVVDEELKRGFGLSIKEIEQSLRAGGDAAEMKFMECCHYLWKVNGVELIEPFILAVFNKLPEKSRCVLFQRLLTIVYLAQDSERQWNACCLLLCCVFWLHRRQLRKTGWARHYWSSMKINGMKRSRTCSGTAMRDATGSSARYLMALRGAGWLGGAVPRQKFVLAYYHAGTDRTHRIGELPWTAGDKQNAFA
jgi:hypothetical protein